MYFGLIYCWWINLKFVNLDLWAYCIWWLIWDIWIISIAYCLFYLNLGLLLIGYLFELIRFGLKCYFLWPYVLFMWPIGNWLFVWAYWIELKILFYLVMCIINVGLLIDVNFGLTMWVRFVEWFEYLIWAWSIWII